MRYSDRGASEYGPEYDAEVAARRTELDDVERAELVRLRRQRRAVLRVTIDAAEGRYGYHGLAPVTDVWSALGFDMDGQPAHAVRAEVAGCEGGADDPTMIDNGDNAADGADRNGNGRGNG